MKHIIKTQSSWYSQNMFNLNIPHITYCDDDNNIKLGSLYGNLVFGLYDENNQTKYDEFAISFSNSDTVSEELSFDHNIRTLNEKSNIKIYAVKNNTTYKKLEVPYSQLNDNNCKIPILITCQNSLPLTLSLKLINCIYDKQLTVYLTDSRGHEGEYRPIWNLSYGEYNMEINTNQCDYYGIQIYKSNK